MTEAMFFVFMLLVVYFTVNEIDGKPGMVDVKIYDHRAYHDPQDNYGKGPWHYVGHGFGITYQYQPDQSYQRERGYSYLHGYGRDLCRDPSKCKPSDPRFFDRINKFNGGQLFYGPMVAEPRLRDSLSFVPDKL